MPLASAKAIQISGTSTPSISRQVMYISVPPFLFCCVCRCARRELPLPGLLLAQVGQEVVHAGQGLGDVLHAGGVAAADKALAAGTEGGAGDDGHLLLHQEALAEVVGAEAGAPDV